jgi:hypothetical protein
MYYLIEKKKKKKKEKYELRSKAKLGIKIDHAITY